MGALLHDKTYHVVNGSRLQVLNGLLLKLRLSSRLRFVVKKADKLGKGRWLLG